MPALPLLFGVPWLAEGLLGTAAAGSAIGAARRSGQKRNPLEDLPDAQTVDQPDGGAFSSFLDTLGNVGGIGNNLLMGNFEGAGRNLVDVGGDIVDAVLPGDWIPHISRRMDKPKFSDVVGGVEPGIGKFAVDVIGGAATDPTTFIPSALIGKGLSAAGSGVAKGVSAVDKVAPGFEAGAQQLSSSLGHGLRKTFAALKPNQQVDAAATAGKDVGGITRQAAQQYPVEAFAGVDPETQRRAVEIIRGVTSELPGPGGYVDLGKGSSKFVSPAEQRMLIVQRIAAMPWDEATKTAVRDTAFKANDYANNLWRQGVADKVFSQPPDVPLNMSPADYFPGKYDLEQAAGLNPTGPRASLPSMVKAKEWTTPGELAEGLTREGGKLDTNIPQVLGEYGEQMGRAAGAATVGSKYLGEGFKALTDPASRKAMTDAVEQLRAAGDLDSAHVLETAFKGIPPRGKVAEFLASRNKPFKAAATGGVIVPRLNFTVGNVTSSVWQTLSDAEARGQTLDAAKRVIPTIFKSIGDGLQQLGIGRMGFDEAQQVAKAAAESGGTRAGMLEKITDPNLKAAVEHGVLDGGFVSSEQMLTQAAERAKGGKSLRNWLYWPQAIAKSSEQQLRYGLFKDLLKKTKDPAEAARIANKTLLDYDVVSAENRTARDVIPFFQFTAKTIPQQAKFLAEQPAVAGALARTQGDSNDPVYPHMEGKLNIPIGEDEQGNAQYLSSLRLPFETLGMIPDFSGSPQEFGRSVEQNVVGSTTPLLKTAYSAISGEDPYFDTAYGSYSKLPGNVEAGAAGRAYNMLAGTGLIQPVATLGQTLGGVIDDRKSPAEKALSLLTGAKIQSVDPDLALQQQLTQQLEMNPEVRQYRSFFAPEGGDETDAILQEYQAMRARLRAKRQQ